MKIDTERFELVPYDRRQLKLAIMNPSKAAEEIGGIYTVRSPEDTAFQRNVHAMKLRLIDQNPDLWLFSTSWQIISKNSRAVLGEVGFKGYHLSGEVEIGYSTHPSHRCRGVMTEAVEALCNFAYTQTEVKIRMITASTKPGNIASERVLQKNRFQIKGKKFHLNYWEKPREQTE